MNTPNYPRFLPGQMLRSDQLNNMVTYLSDQNRLTRQLLIGAGIFCGFEVRWDAGQLKVSKGAGVTTKGHLLTALKDESFTTYTEVSLDKGLLLGNNATGTIKLYELSNKTATGEIKALKEAFLKDRCVLLFHQSNNIPDPDNSCHQTFAEKNEVVQVTIRPFLIDERDLEGFPELPDYPSIDFTRLPTPFIERLQLDGIKDYEQLKTAFFETCKNAIETIDEALNQFWPTAENTADADKIGACFSEHNVFENFKLDHEIKLSAVFEMFPARLPLFYNYLKDFIAAYLELISLGKVSKPMKGCLGENTFPNHLLLGGVGDKDCTCRTRLYCASGCQNEEKQAYEKAGFLYRRLEEMVVHADFMGEDQPVKITPSKGLGKPLSKRAIPFYYQNNGMRSAWNFELKKRNKIASIPGYFQPEDAAPPYDFPLHYDLDAWDFFRVEGQLGKPLAEALEAIVQERKRLNVAFDVQCVPIKETILNVNQEACCPDLEAAYHQLLNEWEWDLISPEISAEEKKLLDYLAFLKLKKLHELDFGKLKELVKPLQNDYNKCKEAFLQFLTDQQRERKTYPDFATFVSGHPGLEHQGGVIPGGTLVLLLDGENNTVVADFNLPYLCCEKPLKVKAPEIFICFPENEVCHCGGPKPVFTYPAGGRVIAAVEGKYPVNALQINPSTGKWHLHPERIPETYFRDKEAVEIKLVFLHSGRQVESAAIRVKRVMAKFEVKAKPEEGCTTLYLSNILPGPKASYYWTLELFGGLLAKPIVVDKLTENNGQFEWSADHPDATPTHATIKLEARQGGCTGSYQVILDLKTNRPLQPTGNGNDNGGGNVRGINDKEDNDPVDDVQESDPDKEETTDEETISNRGEAAGDSQAQANVHELLRQRQERYKERLELLSDDEAFTTLQEFSNVREFLDFPQSKLTIDNQYAETTQAILKIYPSVDTRWKVSFIQLLEILIRAYLDNRFANGQPNFSPTDLPFSSELTTLGINVDSIFTRWNGAELNVMQPLTAIPQQKNGG